MKILCKSVVNNIQQQYFITYFSFSVIGPTNRYPFYSLYHSHLFLYGLELSYGILWQFGTFHQRILFYAVKKHRKYLKDINQFFWQCPHKSVIALFVSKQTIYGPDCLESTILKITGKISLLTQSSRACYCGK